MDLCLKHSANRFHSIQDRMRFWVNYWRKEPLQIYGVWLTILGALDVIWFFRNDVLWQGEKVDLNQPIMLILVWRSLYWSLLN